MLSKVVDFLFRPIDASIVCIFRIIFGLFMTYQIAKYFGLDYTYQFISGPEVLFSYNELSFMQPLPLPILKVLHVLLLVAAVCITIGIWYRYAITYFFIVFTYFSFMDSTLYNNHIYLISLLSFAMIFLQADVKYSYKAYRKKVLEIPKISAWQQYILMFLIALPYFFGGIAKLHSNWLHTNLVPEIITSAKNSYLVKLFSEDVLIPFVKYGGLIYDLGIVFLLLYKRTRIFAVGLILLFNITNNSMLFDDIGIFPFFMILATILFFDSDKVGAFVHTIFGKNAPKKKSLSKKEMKRLSKEKKRLGTQEVEKVQETSNVVVGLPIGKKKIIAVSLIVFVTFHLLFPFRYLLYNNNPEWMGVSAHFAWRMKMQTKEIVTLDLTLKDRATGATGEIKANTFLSHNQMLHFVDRPMNLVQFAKNIQPKIEKEYGITNPMVLADVVVKFNGLPAQRMIVQGIDLTEVDERDYSDMSWIVPLQKDAKE